MRIASLQGTIVAAATGLALCAGLGTGCKERADAQSARPKSSGETNHESGSVASSEEGGEVAADERYRTGVEPGKVAGGEASDVALWLEPAEGLKVNREYPSWNLTFDPPEDVSIEPRSFDRKAFDLSDRGASVQAKISSDTTGVHSLPATANFSVCNDETCHILRDESVRFRIEVVSDDGASGESNGD